MTLQEFINQWNDENTRLLVHTSGSTGVAQPLWVEKQKMLNSARQTCSFLNLAEGSTALLCLPLEFIAGKMMVVRAIAHNMKILEVPVSSHPLAQVDENANIEFAAMVPLQVSNSLDNLEERKKLIKIKHLIIGGGSVSKSLENNLKDLPNAIWSTYGMTETLSHIALRRLNGAEASEWYTPLEGVKVWTNDEGLLQIEAPKVCSVTLRTHDIGEMHKDGSRFKIKGRSDNVVCSGGIKIQIEEVESILAEHLSQNFIITKVPNEKLGEMLVLLVQGDTEEIGTICQKYLPKYWIPRLFFSVTELPYTSTGKPARAKALEIANQLYQKY